MALVTADPARFHVPDRIAASNLKGPGYRSWMMSIQAMMSQLEPAEPERILPKLRRDDMPQQVHKS